jgi:hypothetical protein
MSTALTRRPPAKPEFLGLAKYDAMLNAIGEAQNVDEVKEIHDVMVACEKYARQAQNYDAELRAMDVRVRASVRAGLLIAQMAKNGDRRQKGKSHVAAHDMRKTPTLKDLGITRDQASQWQQLAGIKAEEIEKHLPLATGKKTSERKIIEETRPPKPKPNPVDARISALNVLALRIWGTCLHVEELHGGESAEAIVAVMDTQLLDGIIRWAPGLIEFISQVEKEAIRAKKAKGE